MAKPTLILLPGFLCDETVWREQIAALGYEFDCIVPEYGQMDSFADMAAKVLNETTGTFAVAGHSMGGRIAMEIFRQAPNRVAAIALLDTGCHVLPAGEPGIEEERNRRGLLAIAREYGMRAMGSKWTPPMLHPARRSDAALVDEILSMMERRSPDLFETQMNALLARPECGGLLQEIRCPALVLTGSHDSWSPPEAHAEMAEAIPGSTLTIVPDCGHMSTMECPGAITEAIRKWLSGCNSLHW